MHTRSFPAAFFMNSKNRCVLTILILLMLGGFAFWPGVGGPFVFDDAPNLLHNSFVQIDSLSAASLNQAGYSLQAGPLHRPIAMMTFAINYYFAGSFDSSTPYKLTNIAIHVVNGVLAFLFIRLISNRLTQTHKGFAKLLPKHQNATTWFAGALALLWVVHPLQLTSVLYVVQRMTSLSALFTLLALHCYFMGRLRILHGRKNGGALILVGLASFGTLGILSKENAVLLPLFVLALEATLFPTEAPWKHWAGLSRRTKLVLVAAALIGLATLTTAVVIYALPAYAIRDFTMVERILTQPRVLFFYLSLMVVPSIDRFGLHHDDIVFSTSILSPWTTLPSILGVIVLLVVALLFRRRHPLLSLGLMWFFAGHALESTIIGLEIAHEHRNYFASLGIWMVLGHTVLHGSALMGKRFVAILPLFILACALVTAIRSDQWADFHDLAYYEMTHSPSSADAHNFYGVVLARRGRFDEAIAPFRRAAELNKTEPVFIFNLNIAAAEAKTSLSQEEQDDVVRRIRARPTSGSITLALENIAVCVQNGCARLQPLIIRWMEALIQDPPPLADKSFLYYVLGVALAGQQRHDAALEALESSYQHDNQYLHPLIEIVKVNISRGNRKDARRALDFLEKANRQSRHPRNEEIAQLEALLAEPGAPTRN